MSAPTRVRLEAARVLVVGDAMLDRYWFGAVERISPEAPVPVVLVQREEERLGGAANVALNVRSLGARATLLTVMGDDEPARVVVRLLQERGVERLLGQDPASRAWQLQFREQHVDRNLRVLHRGQGFLVRARLQHVVAGGDEEEPQQAQDRRLMVEDEDRAWSADGDPHARMVRAAQATSAPTGLRPMSLITIRQQP